VDATILTRSEQQQEPDVTAAWTTLRHAQRERAHATADLTAALLSRLIEDEPFAALAVREAFGIVPCITTKRLERIARGDPGTARHSAGFWRRDLTRLLGVSRSFREAAANDPGVAAHLVTWAKSKQVVEAAGKAVTRAAAPSPCENCPLRSAQ
jgi:hypothetical protein